MEINRDLYLNKLKIRMHNNLIKVVTGIRRSGKSYLLFEIFYKYLLSIGVKETHIIKMEFDMYELKYENSPKEVVENIKNRITDNEMYYLLLDEVQMLDDFESVLNSLLHYKNLDIYVTGSNSKFLSKDIITEFRGRGDEIHIYPLSFREYMSVSDKDKYESILDYMKYGGLPLTLTMNDSQQKSLYLTNLFKETYIKDIAERNTIEKPAELEDIINIMASSIGALSNPKKIENTFKSVLGSDISINTIDRYITLLEDAFIINKAQRYDVKGRKYIGSPIKYYFEDVGLRNARIGFRQTEYNHIMENIIYNELKIRGYNIDVGVVKGKTKNSENMFVRSNLEIDFVANKESDRIYVQSAYNIRDIEKENQEKASLKAIKDSYRKIIIVNDLVYHAKDEDGIEVMSLYDFLLKDLV